jgi:hypothetical protein
MRISSILVNCGPLDCVISINPFRDAWRRRWCCEGTLRVITANLGRLYGRRQMSTSGTTLKSFLPYIFMHVQLVREYIALVD